LHLKLDLTVLLVIVSVHDPVLWHAPGALKGVIEHDHPSEATKREEEKIEFSASACLQDEPSLFAVLLQLIVKHKGNDEVHK